MKVFLEGVRLELKICSELVNTGGFLEHSWFSHMESMNFISRGKI
jgi:hypothetical protein